MKRSFYKYFNCFIALIMLSFMGADSVYAQGSDDTGISVRALRDLPILHQGRYKPFDSIARQTLLALTGKSNKVKDEAGNKYKAAQWLAASLFTPSKAVNFKAFLLENPEVADAVGLESSMERVRYSYKEISPHLEKLENLAAQAFSVRSEDRSRFQRHLLQFYDRILKFMNLQKAIWPDADSSMKWADIANAYIKGDQAAFDEAVENYKKDYLGDLDAEVFSDAKKESAFNRVDPFYNSGLILSLAFILALWGMIFSERKPFIISMVLCVAALLLQSYGHWVRMLVMDRPPVTNLYSTFIAVAWICSFVSIIIIKLLPEKHRTLSPLLASVSPLVFLIIAGKYANTGDSMGVMAAVLDSNFWLATHVVTIILGYGGCCLAGVFAHYYMIQLCRTEKNDQDTVTLYKIMLMILGFGFTMTFVGTVTGGVWADQSWGRFWGWDPKENGALLIVLWCAVVFHAKAGNLVSRFWIATGSIITIFIVLMAWFGVNMLGVGLHSYGNDPDSNFLTYMVMYLIFEVVFISGTYAMMKRREA